MPFRRGDTMTRPQYVHSNSEATNILWLSEKNLVSVSYFFAIIAQIPI